MISYASLIGRGLEWNSHSNPASRCFFCPCPWRFSRPNADVAQGWCGPGRRQEISPDVACLLDIASERNSPGEGLGVCQPSYVNSCQMLWTPQPPTHWSKAIVFVGHPPLLGWPILQVLLGHAFVTARKSCQLAPAGTEPHSLLLELIREATGWYGVQ